jgi:hypothetical protein
MATYNLSGSGTQALSSGVTSLHVTITTIPAIASVGQANPANYYKVALLRFGDGVGYSDFIPVQGGPSWIPVPTGTTILGYACLSNAAITVVEVIGGVSPVGASVVATNVDQEQHITIDSFSTLGLPLATRGIGSDQSAIPGTFEIQLCPLRIFQSITLNLAGWTVGGTSNGHIDVGVYSSALALLGHTGSVSAGTISTVQTASIGGIALTPGLYWLAVVSDSTTGTYLLRTITIASKRVLGFRGATQAFPLPSTIVLATTVRANFPSVFVTADSVA